MEEAKRSGLDDDNEMMGEDIVEWLLSSSVEADDTVSDELMKLLETTSGGGDTNATCCCRVKFIDNPYSFSMIFQSSSSYITINGNEESCGSSFSDTDSSVMASLHMASIHVLTNGTLAGYVGGNWGEDAFEMKSGGGGGGACGSNEDDGMVVDGGDGFDEWVEGDDDVDDVLAGFLGDDIFYHF